MRIVVMGAGGLGGYFGARLAAAGNDVAFVARGAHLAAIKQNGLVVEGARGDLHLRDVVATDDPASLAQADIVLFTVKLWDTETAAEAIKPLIRSRLSNWAPASSPCRTACTRKRCWPAFWAPTR